MSDPTPQEIAVWYMIPSIRKELAKEMIKIGASQKKAASLLGLSEPAVSQYFKDKRGVALAFDAKEAEKIKKIAQKIIKDEKNAKKYIYKLSNDFMKSKQICKLHMAHDKSLKKGCDICFE